MGSKSKIQWTEATWNPWHGCVKVSPGCKFCYMYRDKERYGESPDIVSRSKTKFQEPLKWGSPKLIFTCSWSDWFIQDADQWRPEAWEVIRKCPQHTFQILTKRPERIKECLPVWFNEIADRVWIGVSVENQASVGRIKYLAELACITFVSFEPLIEEIQWHESMNTLDWVIVGGESGNTKGKYSYRPMELNWAEQIVSEAGKNGVACFVKQLGTYQANLLSLKHRHGGDITEFPEPLRVQAFPTLKRKQQ